MPATAVTTDEAGRFTAAELLPGKYRVTAEFAGMATVLLEVVVEEAKLTEVDIELKPAGVKEVTVSARADVVETTQTTSKDALHEATIEKRRMPLSVSKTCSHFSPAWSAARTA